jgi:hypothetical protein
MEVVRKNSKKSILVHLFYYYINEQKNYYYKSQQSAKHKSEVQTPTNLAFFFLFFSFREI